MTFVLVGVALHLVFPGQPLAKMFGLSLIIGGGLGVIYTSMK